MSETFLVCDYLTKWERGVYSDALVTHDWDIIRALERVARKRIVGGIVPADAFF